MSLFAEYEIKWEEGQPTRENLRAFHAELGSLVKEHQKTKAVAKPDLARLNRIPGLMVTKKP